MVKTFITTVVAHIDHGKTTLIDSLISATGHISKSVAGEIRYLDTRQDEQSRGITLKLSAIELHYKNRYIIIDTPGHVDFESLVQISARLSESFILVIDINEGITPRLFSIIKFISKNTILVLNKIDKQFEKTVEEIYSLGMNVIIRVNSLIKYELFGWDKNNVVIAYSTMCFGVNKQELKKITEHCALKNCIRFIVELNKRITKNQTESICKKFKIKNKDPKSIWSGVLPLAKVLFEAIETNFTVSSNIGEKLEGITMYCQLKEPKVLKLDNLLFMVRLFSGKISEKEHIICANKNGKQTVQIDELYKFSVNDIERVEFSEAPTLVIVKAPLLKHSYIYTDDFFECNNEVIELTHKPFYKASIILNNFDETDRFKEALRTLSHLEPIFKVKINKYGEYEFYCEGKVHFEKICRDLTDNDFIFTLCKQKMNFHETCGGRTAYKGDLYITVFQSPAMPELYTTAKGTNSLLCKNEKYIDVVKSVFEYLVNHGPLIGEPMEYTHFSVSIDDTLEYDEPFNTIKKCLVAAYNQTMPKLVPLYLICKIQASLNYIGNIYKSLHKYNYVLKDEAYDNDLEFFELFVYFPQFQYYELVEDLRMKTRGTCYIEFDEFGYMFCEKHSFNEFVDDIKKAKGMVTKNVLIADPEKQRTLRK